MKDCFAEKKILTIFAGVNGAGKSTFYYKNCDKFNYGLRINSDEIIESNNEDWRKLRSQINAAKEVLKEQEICLNNGIAFNREMTICSAKSLRMIDFAKQKGFIVNLIYIGLESENLAQKRVLKRVNQGGHGVTKEWIKIRYKLFLSNLLEIYKHFDNVEVYDNSHNDFKLVAKFSNGQFIECYNVCSWGNKFLNILSKANNDEENYCIK